MFRKYRLVPSEAAPSAPQLQQPSAKNDAHMVTDPPDNPILAPMGVSHAIMEPMKPKVVPGGISTKYENEILQNFDGKLEKGKAKLLIDFLKKINLQANENGEILYDNVIGSPLSQMIDFVVADSTSNSQKRPWDLKRFMQFLQGKHLELGISIPWEFLGKGKRQVVQEIMTPPTYLKIDHHPNSGKARMQKPKTFVGGKAGKKKMPKKASSLSNWRHLF